MIAGVGFILIAAILQGVFLLPMYAGAPMVMGARVAGVLIDRNAALQLGADVPGVAESSCDIRPSSAE
jgi:hypothetical protein